MKFTILERIIASTLLPEQATSMVTVSENIYQPPRRLTVISACMDEVRVATLSLAPVREHGASRVHCDPLPSGDA